MGKKFVWIPTAVLSERVDQDDVDLRRASAWNLRRLDARLLAIRRKMLNMADVRRALRESGREEAVKAAGRILVETLRRCRRECQIDELASRSGLPRDIVVDALLHLNDARVANSGGVYRFVIEPIVESQVGEEVSA